MVTLASMTLNLMYIKSTFLSIFITHEYHATVAQCLEEMLANSRTVCGINKPQSGCNEAGRVNDSTVSIVTQCVLAIGDLRRNRVGIMYPPPPRALPPSQHPVVFKHFKALSGPQ